MNYCDMLNVVNSFRCKFKGRIVQNNTRISMSDSDYSVKVRLHNTDVVTFHKGGDITLNTDGWQTVTTKSRINNYLPEGYYLQQRKGEWILRYPCGKVIPYSDGMRITESHTVLQMEVKYA